MAAIDRKQLCGRVASQVRTGNAIMKEAFSVRSAPGLYKEGCGTQIAKDQVCKQATIKQPLIGNSSVDTLLHR
jgi:hypothetical protein